MNIPVPILRKALLVATRTLPPLNLSPEKQPAEADQPGMPASVFLPLSHIRALRPYAQLVTGVRGAGKTFWTQALQQEAVLKMLLRDVPELTGFRVIGVHTHKGHPESCPGPALFSALLKTFRGTDIWRAVLVQALARQPEAAGLCPVAAMPWQELVPQVAQSPETVNSFLQDLDRRLAQAQTSLMLLFDGLERVADSWKDSEALTTALLQDVLPLSGCSRIKAKVFLGEDQFQRLFPVCAAHLPATRVPLFWRQTDLYGLLWNHLCNGPGESGQRLRALWEQYLPGSLIEEHGVWILLPAATRNDDALRSLFHALTGPYMGKGRRRGIPYIWTVGHLADARQQTMPRSFLAAIRRACEDSSTNHADAADHALHTDSLRLGVEAATAVRVAEMQEDYPWAVDLLALLEGRYLPCPFQEVQALWAERYPQGPGMLIQKYPRHVPPEFATQNWQDVREVLDRLGFSMTLLDGRFHMTDLYRVFFGLGRHGGVKP